MFNSHHNLYNKYHSFCHISREFIPGILNKHAIDNTYCTFTSNYQYSLLHEYINIQLSGFYFIFQIINYICNFSWFSFSY